MSIDIKGRTKIVTCVCKKYSWSSWDKVPEQIENYDSS